MYGIQAILDSYCIFPRFENDVKMYGIQADGGTVTLVGEFENDVKMYGIQAFVFAENKGLEFENDVKMYGIQARELGRPLNTPFENDVKMYGIQASDHAYSPYYLFENDIKMYGIQAFTYLEKRMRKRKSSYKDIIDLLDGASGKRILSKGGHSAEYWERDYALEHEAYAHFFSALMVNAPEKVAAIEQTFPTAWEIFKEIIESV